MKIKRAGIALFVFLSVPLSTFGHHAFTGVFDMDVSGTWTVNPLTGKGTFTAYFSQQLSPGGPTILLGGMKGRFEDLESPFGPDRLGSYAARWGLLN